ncbi:MAG TPA: phosphatidylserine decarboxylase [Terriglobales bacterium]|nr:phosphatidylserine decarboxylase [Terriglobales bacterium]
MVRDGIYYALGLSVAAAVLAWLSNPWWAMPPLLLACFFLWFFRDPERAIPADPGLVVSPADGKVTDVSTIQVEGKPRTRISIFLNVFDVHVNRSPVTGTIRSSEYKTGKFLNAMNPACAERNEQNVAAIQSGSETVVLKQIAGLLARRIVFTKKIGDSVARGERIGMMKFGSRTDVILSPQAQVAVRIGDRVKGGSSVLAHLLAPSLQTEQQAELAGMAQ